MHTNCNKAKDYPLGVLLLSAVISLGSVGSYAQDKAEPPAKARVFKSNLSLTVLEWTPEGSLEMRGGTSPLLKKGVSLPAGAVWMVQPFGGLGGFGGFNGFAGGGANLGGGGQLGGVNPGGGANLGAGGIVGVPQPMPPKGKQPPAGLGMDAGFQGEGLKNLLAEMRKQAIPGVSIFGQPIAPDDLEKLITVPGFKTLALQYNPHVTDEHLSRLSKSRDLSTLLIHQAEKLTDKGFASLASMPKLRTLSLMGVNVSDATLVALKDAPALQMLRLGEDTLVTAKGLAELGRFAKLERLDLAKPVDAEMLKTLAEQTKLSTLRVNAVKLEGKELAPLAKSTTLRSLTLDTRYALTPPRLLGAGPDGKLSWNFFGQGFGFGGGGGFGLPSAEKGDSPFQVAAMEQFTELRELVLIHPNMQEADLASLGKLSALERLKIFAPHLGDAGMNALEKLKNLEHLDLTGTAVTPKLVKTLAKLPKLKTLRVNLLATDAKSKAALNAWRTGLPRVQVRPAEGSPLMTGLGTMGGFGG
ncbi:MAG: hypothetical protein SNJ75_14245 [Gemmataceae bacterium]